MKDYGRRLAKLEADSPSGLSEAAKAWLGMRPPLTANEQATHDAQRQPVNIEGMSPELRQWLGL